MKILHFADAHIDMANYGRHDPTTGLPLRVLDFLKSLDEIVEAAISEKVELVLFAGDAYRDRSPAPTFQREWDRRIIRLSSAGIRTLLLVGNHDYSPAVGRANAIQEFKTLNIPQVTVLDAPAFLGAEELGLPLQVIAIPWLARSGLMASTEADAEQVFAHIEERITDLVNGWLEKADPSLPLVLTAHASVQGALYGSERTVMLGDDLVLPGSLVRDPRLDYVALGHIHKPQNLNENAHPPVVYPGSIERVDFGEAGEDKFYVIAEVSRGKTSFLWRKLEHIRPFIDRHARIVSPENVTAALIYALPADAEMEGAILRLTVDYPHEWDTLIDEPALRSHARSAFDFHLVKHAHMDARIRLPADQAVSSLSPLDLLDQYWRSVHVEDGETETLQQMAKEIMDEE
jgi:DNA repair protein SbcD/Mre11